MSVIFVDTHYWIASINPRDQWHSKAVEVESRLIGNSLITTEPVLIEVLNYFSGFGPKGRERVIDIARSVLNRDDVETLTLTRSAFLAGVDLYESRLDKNYSLTDCISMNIMRERGITDVLTHDRNFAQEGFNPLL